jgi:hypothetical protein
MKETIGNLILIAIVVINIIDLSGIIDEIEKGLSKWLDIKAHIPKPFSCSYCMTHWTGLIYLIVTGEWSLATYDILLFICFMTGPLMDLEIWFKDCANRILATFFDLLKR